MELEIHFSGFKQQLTTDGKPFYPLISLSQTAQDGYTVQSVLLDISLTSKLDWREAQERARHLVRQDYLILWEFDFGWDKALFYDEVAYLSLSLGVEHFAQTLWNEFRSVSLGILLHQGVIPIERYEQRMRDMLSIANSLPSDATPFICLDMTSIKESALFFRLCSKENCGGIVLALKSTLAEQFPNAFPFLGWGFPTSLGCVDYVPSVLPLSQRIPLAFCLSAATPDHVVEEVVTTSKEPLRILSERFLTQEWEGVERLIVLEKTITPKLRRKLAGFEAAGGEVLLL